MIQLKVLSGRKAGDQLVVRRFPFRMGREPGVELVLDDPGVWADHAQIEFIKGEGFVLSTHADAVTSVNGEPVQSALLRNGDAIQLGGATVQFWLSDVRQRGLAGREFLVWTGILLATLSQLVLIYLLLNW
jgi:pSer/pThr/pTyr-binding forkhead associated (FHA) protein